jgi:hypothetical protein
LFPFHSFFADLVPESCSYKNLLCLLKKCNGNAAESGWKSAGLFSGGFKHPLRVGRQSVTGLAKLKMHVYLIERNLPIDPGGKRFQQLPRIQQISRAGKTR